MKNIIEIEVLGGNEIEPDTVRISIGEEIWFTTIPAWRRLMHNIEGKIINLHTVEQKVITD